MAFKYLAGALAAGSLAHLIQMSFSCVPDGYRASGAFFASHLLVVTVIHLALMLALAGRCDNRAWAAAAFAVPVALGLWPHVGWGSAIVCGLACPGFAARLWLARGRGAPLLASVAGAIGGVGILGFGNRHFMGLATVPGVVISLAVAAVGALVVLRCSRYVPAALALPSGRNSMLTAVVACVLALLVAGVPLLPARPVPPASVAPSGAHLPPVVLIVLDTVRADHLKLYGYHRDTMPNLERFAREHTVIVEQARSDAPLSLPTHASLFTGLHSPRHGAHGPGVNHGDPPPVLYPLREDVPTLASLLADAGYWTVGISANFAHLTPAYGCGRGFHVYWTVPNKTQSMKLRSPWCPTPGRQSPLVRLDGSPPFSDCDFFGLSVPYRRAKTITNDVIAVLDAAGDRPLFLFVNYFDAHGPHYPPRAFLDRFPGLSRHLPPDGVSKRGRKEVNAGQRVVTAEERAHLTALYDGELAYLDSQLKRLLDRLEQHPRWEEMMLVVVGDHGEAFGEHRYVGHGLNLYAELLNVPLFVKPGVRKTGVPPPGTILPGPIQSVDVFATVLERVGLPADPDIDGRPWGRGRTELLAFSYCPPRIARKDPERFERDLRMVERDGWKLIDSTRGVIELYDLVNDPGETNNLADLRPEIRDSLLSVLGRIPWPTVAPDRQAPEETEETIRMLRSLGYVE